DLGASSLTPPWGQLRQDAGNTAVARSDGFSTGLITSLYVNALGRPPSADDLNAWLPVFRRAPSLRTAVLGVLTSPEARGRQVGAWYQSFLGHAANNDSLTSWLNFLAGGQTDVTAEALIAASPEAFRNLGGTNQQWVLGLFASILGRDPGGQESGLVN